MGDYQTVIGLEVHCQLQTKSKIFCGCTTKFGAEPNYNTCPVCLGMPGVLPVLNAEVLRYALRLGLALNCDIRMSSRLARKNYFYPDLPKGYQISQFDEPILEGGAVHITVNDAEQRVALTRIHIEEDAGKLIHCGDRNESQVDYNRTGLPLLEIVSEPVMHTSDEAVSYLKALHNIVQYIEICDGHMEQGSFRCDANVSIRPVGVQELGTRTELKNLNSFNHVKRAIDYEISRQIDCVESGDSVVQETRLWDEKNGRTRPMRGKEEAHDYRYFSDPDLLPIVVPEDLLADVRDTLPELPDQRRQRYIRDYELSPYDADVLTSDKSYGPYFESVCSSGIPAKLAANWVQGELLGRLNADGNNIENSPIDSCALGKILKRVVDGTISGKQAKRVFQGVYSGQDIEQVLAEVGEQLNDPASLSPIIEKILDAHPKEVSIYLGGKTKTAGYFVGQVMRETQGNANPGLVNRLIAELLEKRRPSD